MMYPTLLAAALGAGAIPDAIVDEPDRPATNIVNEPGVRWDNVVPPMRRNGAAWQPGHSLKRKNKIRRQRAAGGRS